MSAPGQSLSFGIGLRVVRLPKLPIIVKARYVSEKAEYVVHLACLKISDKPLLLRAKIKAAGGVVKLIA